MKRKIIITAALLFSFTAVFAFFADMNGKWVANMKTPDGNEFSLAYTIKTDNDKLTGTVESTQGAIEITDGKVKGDSLYFSVDVGGTKVLNSGKYFAAGDSIGLTINFNGTAYHHTLKRAADK